jgi:Uma2 family endonuclease
MKSLELEKPEILSHLEDMTEEEFVDWYNEDVKAEFVDGEVIVHSPVTIDHESIGTFLTTLLNLLIHKNDLGKFFGSSRFQARLRTGLRREPDLMFISKDRLSILRKNHIEGAPDLAVEIVSPDSLTRDWREKYYEYEQAGVKEYWVSDPNAKRMDMYHLDEHGNYELITLEKGKLHSRIFPGFWVKPEWFWQEELPNVLEVAKELNLV